MRALLDLLVAALVLFSSSLVFAKAALWGIAINSQTKECAAYWAGDEFTRYSLKEGWKDYYSRGLDAGYGITTEFGTCTFERGNEKSCCEQLKLSYVAVDWPKQDLGTDGSIADRGCSTSAGSMPTGGSPLAACALLLGLLLIRLRPRSPTS